MDGITPLVRIPTPEEGNQNWPLPPDYENLPPEGQRRARVNACRQWMLKGDFKSADNLVAAVNFFDKVYLRDPSAMFYPPNLIKPTPEFHNEILRCVFDHSYNVLAAPRGHAKSFLAQKLILCLIISCPMFAITYATSTNSNAKRVMNRLMTVIRRSKRLLADFGPEYGGSLIPPRGQAAFGSEYMTLTNGSSVFPTSAESRNRGDRPQLFVLDDPEFDTTASTNMEQVRANVDELIFKIIMPMVQQEGCKIFWIGTTISRQHFLWKALSIDPDTGKAVDPRFEAWHRLKFQALYTLPDGSETSLWPELLPPKRLRALKKEMGLGSFFSEYMNDPGSGEGKAFWLDDERHGYKLTNIDELYYKRPRESITTIEYTNSSGERIEKPFQEFMKRLHVVATVDWALTVSATSDYSAVAVLGFTPENELFVLDLAVGKWTGSQLATTALRIASKWKPRAIGVEAPNVEFHLAHMINTRMQEAAESMGFMPRVLPLKHYNQTKQDRIEGLQWRFGEKEDHEGVGLIKFPMQWRSKDPWKMLFSQIEQFTPLALDGGLENDDAIDAVSMGQDKALTPGLPNRGRKAAKPKDDIQLCMQGKVYDNDGHHRLQGIQLSSLPKEVLETIIEAYAKRSQKNNGRNGSASGVF